MSSYYRDSTSYVSTSSRANDYSPISDYSQNGFQSVPRSSVMKMTVAPGGEKFFSVDPSFQTRLDSFRISAPVKTPVSISEDGYMGSSQTMMSSEGVKMPSNGSDYAYLSSGAYRTTSM